MPSLLESLNLKGLVNILIEIKLTTNPDDRFLVEKQIVPRSENNQPMPVRGLGYVPITLPLSNLNHDDQGLGWNIIKNTAKRLIDEGIKKDIYGLVKIMGEDKEQEEILIYKYIK